MHKNYISVNYISVSGQLFSWENARGQWTGISEESTLNIEPGQATGRQIDVTSHRTGRVVSFRWYARDVHGQCNYYVSDDCKNRMYLKVFAD